MFQLLTQKRSNTILLRPAKTTLFTISVDFLNTLQYKI